MDQDMSNMFAETVELTAVAEMWRDRAEAAEREVARLRALFLREELNYTHRATVARLDLQDRLGDARSSYSDAEAAERDRIRRAIERCERIERAEPAFGGG